MRRRWQRRPERITTDVLPPGSRRQRKWALQRSRREPRPAPPPPGPAQAALCPFSLAPPPRLRSRPTQAPLRPTDPPRPYPASWGRELRGRAPSRPSARTWAGVPARGRCRELKCYRDFLFACFGRGGGFITAPPQPRPRSDRIYQWELLSGKGGASPAKRDICAEGHAHRQRPPPPPQLGEGEQSWGVQVPTRDGRPKGG